jgi:DNA-binding transcriptional ArsR family regulator
VTRQQDESDQDAVWRALANRDRRDMLDLLREKPRTTSEIATQFSGLSRFAVMQHLRVLEHGRLVVQRRLGRERFNYLNPVPLQQVLSRWIGRYDGTWIDSLIALKDEVERDGRSRKAANARR